MKTFYHSLIMWIPFILLFSIATVGLETVEGNKIRTTEYLGLDEIGPAYLLLTTALFVMLYPISFLSLTFIVNKYVIKSKVKIAMFTLLGGMLGVLVFKILYNSRFGFIEEYNLNILSAIILFAIAGLLFALAEISIKKNIKFV
ncbi:hypothetical protein [Solibacillus sp. FSL K6-1523]|uniref:hypothetical protein n=1 Tax=Solibacillus sp. FSL K6-1523 TaxID=2921471 RepID=UPI0030F50B5B